MFGFYREPWLQEQSCDWVCKYLVFWLSWLLWQLKNGLSFFLIINRRGKACFKASNRCSKRQEKIFNSGEYTFSVSKYDENAIISNYLYYLVSFVITANQEKCFVLLYCIQWWILKCQLLFLLDTDRYNWYHAYLLQHTGNCSRHVVAGLHEICLTQKL